MTLALPFSPDLLTAAAAFGLVLALWLGVVLVWARRQALRDRKLRERLELPLRSADRTHVVRLWHEGKEVTTVVPDDRQALSPAARWQRMCRDADFSIPPGRVLLLVVCATAAAGGIGAATGNGVWALLSAAAVIAGFWTLVRRKTVRHATLFEEQFLDALDMAARSLRAGHPLIGAFNLICQEVPAPIGTIFAEICQQQQLGVAMEEALRRAAAESHSGDLKLFATSVSIQLRSGGNLADMMERLALVIRDRIRIARRIRVLTAQTQFSKRVLAALPVFLFLLLNFLNPKYMQPMYASATGRLLLAAAAAGVLLGMWVMNRLTVLQY